MISPSATAAPGTNRPYSSQHEALARCLYLQRQRRPLGLVTGPSGAGKSWILQEVLRSGQADHTILIEMSGIDGETFQAELACELGLTQRAGEQNPFALFEARLRSLAECRLRQTILLDHLDEAQLSVLPILRRMLRLQSRFPWTTLLATAKSPLSEPLQTLAGEFCDMKIEVAPLEPSEAKEMIHSKLSSMPMTEEAADRICRLTSRVPKELDRLLRMISPAVEVEQAGRIDEQLVSDLAQEIPLSQT